MTKRPRKAPNVESMDPGARLFGRDSRDGMNSARSTEEKVRLGGQFGDEQDEWRARFYFTPDTARRLRAVTAQPLGRRLGGS